MNTAALLNLLHENRKNANRWAGYRLGQAIPFYLAERTGGPWDYKQRDSNFENFGNYHYGYIGTSLGFPEGILLRQAGKNQDKRARKASFGNPGNGLWGGVPPYGDDPKDQEMIKRGIYDRLLGL